MPVSTKRGFSSTTFAHTTLISLPLLTDRHFWHFLSFTNAPLLGNLYCFIHLVAVANLSYKTSALIGPIAAIQKVIIGESLCASNAELPLHFRTLDGTLWTDRCPVDTSELWLN